MALSQKPHPQLQKLKKYTLFKKPVYILYGSHRALQLYNESLQSLLHSDCMDFGVFSCSKNQEPNPEIVMDIFNVEGHNVIDQKTYKILYLNLCQKVRREKLRLFAKMQPVEK